MNPINSSCCCKETPSTAGWKLDIFYPHCTGIRKVVFLLATYASSNKRMLSETHIFIANASVCSVNWIALRVKGIYWMAELFWKQLMDDVRVKIIMVSAIENLHNYFSYFSSALNHSNEYKYIWQWYSGSCLRICLHFKETITW